MRVGLAEVAPVAIPLARVIVNALLIPFAALAGYFVAWGLVFCMDAVVRAFFGTAEGLVGWIPYAGRVLTSPLLAIEHKLTSFLGGLEQHFERQMATRWHALAAQTASFARNIVASAVFDYQIARKLSTVWAPATINWLLRHAHVQTQVVQSQATTITKTVTRVEKIVSTKAPAAVAHELHAVAGELEHVIEWDLPRLRARERSLSDSLERLWRRVRGQNALLGAGALAAVIATVLGRLGVGWIRCSSVGKVGRRLCGMDPRLLEGLLLGTVALYSGFSLVQLAEDLLAVEGEIVAGIKLGVKELRAF